MATQADVAARAGVSRRTVSNVVNGYPHISADVLRRVNQAIAELGYLPSHAARSLRLGRTGVIQLVVPELDVAYFAELARRVVKAAEDRGYIVLIRQTLGDHAVEQDALRGPAAQYAEGTILSPVGGGTDWLDESPRDAPVVLIGESGSAGGYDHVGIDDEAAAYDATRHLIARGRRRIAYIGSDPDNLLTMARKREAGYRRAIAEAGTDVDGALVLPVSAYHRDDGRDALRRLWEAPEHPDAIFCATDLLALGALREAFEIGVGVPGDLAVVGFDDLEEGRYSIPSLTTISPDKRRIAELAVELLVKRIDDGAVDPAEMVIPHRLVVREST